MANEIDENKSKVNREKLLNVLKKEVKQIMEEAVTRKFIHQESSSITSLSAAIDACLQYGLKKWSLGLFKQSSSSSLLQKISKNCQEANQVVKIVNQVESESKFDFTAELTRKILDNNNQKIVSKSTTPSYHPKNYWIRVALFEKVLPQISDYLVHNSSKFYSKGSLLSDSVDGPLFSSLLVGPCCIDYTKMKTPDHLWTDPPADELVQRHRIHSGNAHYFTKPESPKRPSLQVQRHTSSSSEESLRGGTPVSAKEYVESLHQNMKTMLLFGKNNVMVQPKEDVMRLAGYLSLHQSADGLTIKWTPNQLMNSSCQDTSDNFDRRLTFVSYKRFLQHKVLHLYWDYAVTVYVEDIVYIHCHQQSGNGGTVVLVGQDGVQHPPLHFPRGGHLLAFLSCLENGLLPHGQLDPPLWSQRGKGKVFPKLRRKGSRLSHSDLESIPDDEPTDYVFRIINLYKPELPKEIMEPNLEKKELKNGFHFNGFTFPWKCTTDVKKGKPQLNIMETYAQSQQQQNDLCITKSVDHRSSIKHLCDTMKKQITSRAFYGWIAHCRHLKTVRTHLAGLVLHNVVEKTTELEMGLTMEIWNGMNKGGCVDKLWTNRISHLVYFGGINESIRKEVWPYMLGHYSFGSIKEDRDATDQSMRTVYEQTMSEWLAVEAIVKQKEKETFLANQARMSQECSKDIPDIPFVRQHSNISNDVFIDNVELLRHCDTIEENTSMESSPKHRISSASESRTHFKSQNPSLDFPDSILDSPTKKSQSVPHSRLPSETESSYIYRSLSESEIHCNGMVKSVFQKRWPLKRECEIDNNSIDEGLGDSVAQTTNSRGFSSSTTRGLTSCECDSIEEDPGTAVLSTVVHVQSVDDDRDDEDYKCTAETTKPAKRDNKDSATTSEHGGLSVSDISEHLSHLSASKESLMSGNSPTSHGGVYSSEFLENVGLNLHRIDKDVHRCDRNHPFFTPVNLEKLRNIMCTYVWDHLDVGYVQGMCDLLAPLLVILQDEAIAYSCFCELMKRMTSNFPHGGVMDVHFANMRSLIQILDCELFEHMHLHGDYTHFYFCYRWFLLDFKRELAYEDIFTVWETIWSAKNVSTVNFGLFIALALVEFYREIIIDNNMDFTDIIKFFNEMAERHDAKRVLHIGRELVLRLQNLIDNK